MNILNFSLSNPLLSSHLIYSALIENISTETGTFSNLVFQYSQLNDQAKMHFQGANELLLITKVLNIRHWLTASSFEDLMHLKAEERATFCNHK